MKTAPSIAASLVLLALFAPTAEAAPNPAYTVNPSPPRCGDSATYTDASTVDAMLAVAKVEWDFNNDGTYDVVDETAPFTAQHTYATRGTKTFGMRVTDNMLLTPGVTAEDQTVNVVTAAPHADFTPSDASPLVGSQVLFAADTSDPDGDAIASYSWDFNGDGEEDADVRNPVHAFSEAGPQAVTLTVTDSCGAPSAPAEQVINVLAPLVPDNKPPVARFVFSPQTADVGEPVEFVSSSTDPDGSVREQAWDFDGDGAFDDARGDDVLHTFTTAGVKTVRLQVIDSAGAAAISTRQITVTEPPKAPPGRLDPDFQFNGLLFSTGTRVQLLWVRAPRGSLITVRCKGKGCPAKQRRKRIKKGAVRFKTYERFLRKGIRLEVFVAKAGKIGTYRRYTIRAGRRPAKLTRCIKGMKLKPVKCSRTKR